MNAHEMKRLLNSNDSHFGKEKISDYLFRHESNKENSPRNKKSSEETSTDSIISETSAQRARAELKVLEQERSKLEKQRKIQLKEFETAKSDARRLLEVD